VADPRGRANPAMPLTPPQCGCGIHCGQLILKKISKIYATRCQILRLKCPKFDFRWGSAPDPGRGAYSAPPEVKSKLYLRGLLLRGGRGNGGGRVGPSVGESGSASAKQTIPLGQNVPRIVVSPY